MAIVEMVNKSYKDTNAVGTLVSYATDLEKTGGMIGGVGVHFDNPEAMVFQMKMVKHLFGKEEGYRQIRHFIVSFAEDEAVILQNARFIAFEIAQYYGGQYQICYGVHQDTEHLHIHFVFNTVSYIDGKLYSGGPCDLQDLKCYVRHVISKYVPSKRNILILD